jgi:hypothetical protein
MAMTQPRKLTPTASVDDALQDAFRRIEAQPVPDAIEALIDKLAGEADAAGEPES